MDAIVRGNNLPISTKHAIEICNFIRYKNLDKARIQLKLVLIKKLAIPLKRFNKDRGHKKGRIAAGFYPIKASKEIINLLNNVEANAQNKGMNIKELILKEVIANKASTPYHYGRQRGIKVRRTHIEITVEEKKQTSKKKIISKKENKKGSEKQ